MFITEMRECFVCSSNIFILTYEIDVGHNKAYLEKVLKMSVCLSANLTSLCQNIFLAETRKARNIL